VPASAVPAVPAAAGDEKENGRHGGGAAWS
jgi:hypothetical protein